MMPKPLLRAWLVLTALLYAVLAYGSYVTLPSYADGMLGFDMRPLGMGDADGARYLQQLGDDGRAYYLSWLKPLDTAFIAVATGLLLALGWVISGISGAIAVVAALGYAGSDVVENAKVAGLLSASFEPAQTSAISAVAQTTRVKFACLGLAILALIVGRIRKGRHG